MKTLIFLLLSTSCFAQITVDKKTVIPKVLDMTKVTTITITADNQVYEVLKKEGKKYTVTVTEESTAPAISVAGKSRTVLYLEESKPVTVPFDDVLVVRLGERKKKIVIAESK